MLEIAVLKEKPTISHVGVFAILLAAFFGSPACSPVDHQGRPNILWITTEDQSRDDVGCYGHPLVKTPNIDRLAAEGVRFTNAFAAAPSCSPTRSGLITGMCPISIGAHNQRNNSAKLPEGIKILPQHLKEAGYFCVNVHWDLSKPGKTDFQFQWDREAAYEDALDWAQREPGQPFFAQVNIPEPHRTNPTPDRVFARDADKPINPDDVPLPPYYPDDPVVRIDFSQYLEAIQVADRKVGGLLKKLENEGDAVNTVVFVFGDHGRPFPHGKQYVYDEELAIPFIVRWPGKVEPGTVCDDLISMVDFAPTVMRIAGLDVPEFVDGIPFLGFGNEEREYVFASRDRVDDAVDRIRCVRTRHFKYIRNFYPEKPYDLNETYMVMNHPTLAALRKLHAEGKLNKAQAKWMASSRPEEELYDLQKDPWELHNITGNPEYREALETLRRKLDEWIEQTGDRGQYPESEEFLDKVRAEYKNRRAQRFTQYDIKGPEQLYGFWRRSLKPTVAK